MCQEQTPDLKKAIEDLGNAVKPLLPDPNAWAEVRKHAVGTPIEMLKALRAAMDLGINALEKQKTCPYASKSAEVNNNDD